MILGEVFKGLRDGPRTAGIEIEVEKCHGGSQDCNLWQCKADESLRSGGVEFITPPILMDDVGEYLSQFYHAKNIHGWEGNIRTGIHAHFDVRDFTIENLAALTCVNVLVEPGLFEFVGPIREECIYCVPWYRAPNDIRRIGTDLNLIRTDMTPARETIDYWRGALSKYTSLYFEPIRRFGTVEFRQAPTWNNGAEAHTWLMLLNNLIEYAATRSPQEVMAQWHSFDSPRRFFRAVTGGVWLPSKGYGVRVNNLPCELLAEEVAAPWMDEDVVADKGWHRIDQVRAEPEKGEEYEGVFTKYQMIDEGLPSLAQVSAQMYTQSAFISQGGTTTMTSEPAAMPPADPVPSPTFDWLDDALLEDENEDGELHDHL